MGAGVEREELSAVKSDELRASGPSALDDYLLFDLQGYLVVKNAVDPALATSSAETDGGARGRRTTVSSDETAAVPS